MGRLEGEGRLRFVEEDRDLDHAEALRRIYGEAASEGHTLWVSLPKERG